MIPPLPDILEGDLDIVFVGINPGTYSAEMGHYYAQPANRFWSMLHQSCLLPRFLDPLDDWKLPRFRLGLTDLVKRVTSGSSELKLEELKNGGLLLQQKIKFYRPRIVCFNGLLVYRTLFHKNGGPGLKGEKMGSAQIYVIPSTSPRNAQYTNKMLLDWFRNLNQVTNKVTS
ncbi:MAG: mismatch-specific DNA-glycosylase [Nitrospiria bacterium]